MPGDGGCFLALGIPPNFMLCPLPEEGASAIPQVTKQIGPLPSTLRHVARHALAAARQWSQAGRWLPHAIAGTLGRPPLPADVSECSRTIRDSVSQSASIRSASSALAAINVPFIEIDVLPCQPTGFLWSETGKQSYGNPRSEILRHLKQFPSGSPYSTQGSASARSKTVRILSKAPRSWE